MRVFLYAVLMLVCLVTPSAAYLTDTNSHAVPDDGTYDRDTWNHDNGSFPTVGNSYTDPVFNEPVTRLTANNPSGGTGLSMHYQWNADGTKIFHQLSGQVNILNAATGAVVKSNTPGNFDASHEFQWSPVNANEYYWTDGASIKKRNISTDTTSTVKTFGSTLGVVGHKGLWIVHPADDDGNANNLLFLVNLDNQFKVWELADDEIYDGTFSTSDNRWTAFTPDGRYLVRATTTGSKFYSIRVWFDDGEVGDGATSSQTGTLFWDSMCFDHGALVSTTGGDNYLITGACLHERWHYRVDITLNQSGRTKAQQAADNDRLFQTDASGVTGNTHYSCAAKQGGAMQDFCWASNEDYNETAGSPGTWYAHKQEIVVVDMVNLTTYRMAHHRSYPLSGKFCSMPRVNASPDGTKAFFMSTHGLTETDSCGYSDVYLLDGSSIVE